MQGSVAVPLQRKELYLNEAAVFYLKIRACLLRISYLTSALRCIFVPWSKSRKLTAKVLHSSMSASPLCCKFTMPIGAIRYDRNQDDFAYSVQKPYK